MSNGARRLTVQELLHYYRPDEIDQSRGIYSFAPRSPLLKVIFETPDSNRDWKSHYFFLKGDEWMCHPGDTEYMPIDTTWDILHPSGMHPSQCVIPLHNHQFIMISSILLTVFFFAIRWRPQVDLEEFSFLERVFTKTKPEERTWAKLVTLDTIHWYCDRPQPTPAAIKYEAKIHQHKSVFLILV